MSKWTNKAEDVEGDTGTEMGEPSGGGSTREVSRKGKKTAEEDLVKPIEDTKRRRIGEVPQLSSPSDTDATPDDKPEAKEASTTQRWTNPLYLVKIKLARKELSQSRYKGIASEVRRMTISQSLPLKPRRCDIAAIVKDAPNHHPTPPFEKILKEAIERTRLEERVKSLEKEATRLQQELQEERKKVEEERRRGELAVANLDTTGRRL
ncbi:hypothetical protein MMC22_003600 [Lobaria immixta]|nr:hypothetical protein [Lobaria immixta]